jgi:hypothetical protein
MNPDMLVRELSAFEGRVPERAWRFSPQRTPP